LKSSALRRLRAVTATVLKPLLLLLLLQVPALLVLPMASLGPSYLSACCFFALRPLLSLLIV
jgi:hypothetical protein